MSLDTVLDDASTSLRATPVAPPPPFGEVLERHQRHRRRNQAIVTVASVVLVIVGVVAVLRTTEREVGVVAGDPPVTTEPAVPTIQGAGLDVIGTGAFRLTARPGALEGVTDLPDTRFHTNVLDLILWRTSDLTTIDAVGNQYRVESFEGEPETAPWLEGQLPAGFTPVPIGPHRVGALERTDAGASLAWAYDAERVVRVSVTPADEVNPTPDLLAHVAGSVLAADRLPRGDGPPVAPPADVTGLPYLEAEQVLLDQGHIVRLAVEPSTGFEGPSTVVGIQPFVSGSRSAVAITTRTSTAGIAPMVDANDIPTVPAGDEFVPVVGQGDHGGSGFIHTRDFGLAAPGVASPPPPGSPEFPVISVLPDGELAGTWENGFVPLDVLIDPGADLPEVPNEVSTTTMPEPGIGIDEPGRVPPDGVAPGWVSIALDGVTIAVPPTWTVVEDGACPIAANSLVVGDAGGSALPGTDVPWIQIRWLPDDLAELGDFTTTCVAGSVNGADACRVDDGTSTERITFDGTDAFIEISYGVPRANLGDITNTIRVSGAPRNVQPIGIARSWVDALHAGDCAALFDLASDELRAGRTQELYEADCRAVLPIGPVTFVSAQVHAAGPGGARTTVIVADRDGGQIEHHLRLAHRFDPAIRGTRWSVVTTDGT